MSHEQGTPAGIGVRKRASEINREGQGPSTRPALLRRGGGSGMTFRAAGQDRWQQSARTRIQSQRFTASAISLGS